MSGEITAQKDGDIACLLKVGTFLYPLVDQTIVMTNISISKYHCVHDYIDKTHAIEASVLLTHFSSLTSF